jgi:MFS family permease
MTAQEPVYYCANHPTVETNLRCNRCEKPICARCAVLTPTGYRCPECLRSQQKVFNTAVWFDYIVALAIATILAYIGSLIVSRIGFFTLFVAPIAGMVIAEAIRFAIRRRRSKNLFRLTAAATALGSLIPLVLSLIAGFLGFSMIWQIAFSLVVTSTVYYRLAGISI